MRDLLRSISERLAHPAYLAEAPRDAPSAYYVLHPNVGLATPVSYGDTHGRDLAIDIEIACVTNMAAGIAPLVEHLRSRLTMWEPRGGWSPLAEVAAGPYLPERDGDHVRWSANLTYHTTRRRTNA